MKSRRKPPGSSKMTFKIQISRDLCHFKTLYLPLMASSLHYLGRKQLALVIIIMGFELLKRRHFSCKHFFCTFIGNLHPYPLAINHCSTFNHKLALQNWEEASQGAKYLASHLDILLTGFHTFFFFLNIWVFGHNEVSCIFFH